MKVQELLSDKTKWTQGSFAKNADGLVCNMYHSTAVCVGV